MVFGALFFQEQNRFKTLILRDLQLKTQKLPAEIDGEFWGYCFNNY
jgi:hypothetical protein